MSGCLLATGSATKREAQRPRHLQDTSFVPRRPRRSCGAAGTQSQTEMKVHSSTEITRKIESCVGTGWCQQFSKESGAAHFHTRSRISGRITTCTWLLMKVVLPGQNQDALRRTLWRPRNPSELTAVWPTTPLPQRTPPSFCPLI